jgi:cytidyltransferase-like protein
MIVKYTDLNALSSTKTIFVMGTFDILHIGHIHFFEQAKIISPKHKLLVAIVPDKIVRERKGLDRPVNGEQDRAEIVDSLKMVDYVFIAPERSLGEISKQVIGKVRPEYSAVSREEWENRTEEWAVGDTELVLLDKIYERSTTKIVQKIRR